MKIFDDRQSKQAAVWADHFAERLRDTVKYLRESEELGLLISAEREAAQFEIDLAGFVRHTAREEALS